MLNESEGAATVVEPWRDARRAVDERVADLLGRMTLREKVAQLYGIWLGMADGDGDVAPFQHDLVDADLDWPSVIKQGLGQLTRPLGSAPVTPVAGTTRIAEMQADIVAANRFGIPAMVHEECLSGLMAWGATIYPTALAWGASFDPGLVGAMAGQLGAMMRELGVHQGLAPVLDVARDPRWGRTEETMGEDPYLVATLGAAYVRGLETAGVVATLKHLVGYSASRGARNFGPVAIGRRELADVLLPPFLHALTEGGARSVMHSYAEVDGVPPAADGQLLTRLLREEWGFAGTVVSDYFGVTFIETQHGLSDTAEATAALALTAGVDVELPTVRCYGDALVAAVRSGRVNESFVDRATARVLRQKCELGLLDPDWEQPTVDGRRTLDPEPARVLARRIARESVVLLTNDGTLPLAPGARVALVGPQAATVEAMIGCYTFPSHVGSQFPGTSLGIDIPTLLDALAAELGADRVEHAPGCDVLDDNRDGIAQAVAAAERAEVCVLALGDRAGLFGRGTSGEGCDVTDLRLPGVQPELLEAVLATGTPVALVLFSGRPYALGRYAGRLAAIVQAFFPGEEGGPAVAEVLSGAAEPGGRLPVSVPADPFASAAGYLTPVLGRLNGASSVDPTALFPFGHGLSYSDFTWSAFHQSAQRVDTTGEVTVGLTVTNTGDRDGSDVVQLYLHDPVAQVTRPVMRLVGYAKVRLAPGESSTVEFRVPAAAASFTGLAGRRIVEPGEVELRIAASSAVVRHVARVELTGQEVTLGQTHFATVGVNVS
ncbi:glycosyl hydrolase [Actinophytocola xinjiangensis]|uniref:Exo-alpha-(1->6)-L-arabinopyranosidase n=1 Tax=Actinophytocola xinjiangensis TaxID=485602 RepID=A0A7Z0WHU2_9PSEU|nr:glycoside hydrolase family 3 N-terminal domain-containing protein [Actinophytocola xinjiangensis]OLF07523.1 glycosyl hydrolase [Actinophytocola xinjiangensis]